MPGPESTWHSSLMNPGKSPPSLWWLPHMHILFPNLMNKQQLSSMLILSLSLCVCVSLSLFLSPLIVSDIPTQSHKFSLIFCLIYSHTPPMLSPSLPPCASLSLSFPLSPLYPFSLSHPSSSLSFPLSLPLLLFSPYTTLPSPFPLLAHLFSLSFPSSLPQPSLSSLSIPFLSFSLWVCVCVCLAPPSEF